MNEVELFLAGVVLELHLADRAARLGHRGLSGLDALVLLGLHRRGSALREDLAVMLGLKEMHIIDHSVGKLRDRALVRTTRRGKSRPITITSRGRAACALWHAEPAGSNATGTDGPDIAAATASLHSLARHFDEIARLANAQRVDGREGRVVDRPNGRSASARTGD